MKELARVVVAVFDGAGHRIPVHVHVEHAHEDRDPDRGRFEVRGLVHLGDADDRPVGGRDDRLLAPGPGAERIAEKDQEPDRERQPDERPHPPPGTARGRGPHAESHERPAGENEGPAFWRHAHQAVSSACPVTSRYASRYRSLVAWTTSLGSAGGGASPFHLPCFLMPAR